MTGSLEEVIRRERETTTDRIWALTADISEITDASSTANSDDEHDPEGSTLAYERAQASALLLQAQVYVIELDEALERYARCGAPISMERLEARPTVQTCARCATAGRSVRDASGRD
jgi:RNA polymerase-binding transcription factor DksA